ncbi:hypothetical protein C0Q44_16065 [Paenibacillus sp. PCH8]|uniref:hypothetical protein n=1 Tax=Paenibacillus sp. PCH8 TaxID=2066524 RepID=UPI000CF9A2A2|nr:hypothetical protein [Paenibacillus sp. PCH8]PQP82885.1 hypothetical protein C0Q44_16065 [Paenibacillus sp. PCH8]
MNRAIFVLIGSISVLTFLNKLIYDYVASGYSFFLIFILNISMILMYNAFFHKKQVVDETNVEYDYNAKSISILIKLLTYCMPIILLIGLYLVNLNGVLDLDSANNWVSFILAIVAFALSLISIYQSESTFKKMMEHLTDIKASSMEMNEAIQANSNKPVVSPVVAASTAIDSGFKGFTLDPNAPNDIEK